MPRRIDMVRIVKGAATHGTINTTQARLLLDDMDRLAKLRTQQKLTSLDRNLKDVAGEIQAQGRFLHALNKRNMLLTVKAKRAVTSFAEQPENKTLGKGLLNYMVGTSKPTPGGRRSVDYQVKALHMKYAGRLIADLEREDLLQDFIKNRFEDEIFLEMGELSQPNGRPGITGNPRARRIAEIIEPITDELVTRQNYSGAFIRRLPGYIIRQTHDQAKIRALGGLGNKKTQKDTSFTKWRDFVLPRLDHAATFKGADPNEFLRNVHEGLWSGVHGPPSAEADVNTFRIHGSLAKKTSAPRLLHFKDAQAALEYHKEFGTRSLRDSVLKDILHRARTAALMENFGPNPQETFAQLKRELGERARGTQDPGQVDSLDDWRIEAAFNTLTGANDHPPMHARPFASIMEGLRMLSVMSKMGRVVLSAFADKAFLQTEMAYQGISQLDAFAKQFMLFLPKGPEEKRTLRLLGVTIDGILGQVVNRYTPYNQLSSSLFQLQQKFYNLNFLNQWTDAHKGAAAQLMMAHLGTHAGDAFDDLPEELRTVLPMYDIDKAEWEIIRKTAWKTPDGDTYVTPDRLNIPQADLDALLAARGQRLTAANRHRLLQELETSLRTYFIDRVDIAVPTSGTAERIYTQLNTRAGTPLGEALRTLMMFKSFPITIMNKVMGREFLGRGSTSVADWLFHGDKGKWYLLMQVALGTALGYLSGVVRDALVGRTPKPLINEDGEIVWNTVNEAMLRSGGLGILGDLMFTEFDRQYQTALGWAAGPVFGQLDPLFALRTSKNPAADAGKLVLNNTPFINLFYIRPVLDYLVLWQLQEALSPGYQKRRERSVEEKNQQGFFVRPSEVVR